MYQEGFSRGENADGSDTILASLHEKILEISDFSIYIYIYIVQPHVRRPRWVESFSCSLGLRPLTQDDTQLGPTGLHLDGYQWKLMEWSFTNCPLLSFTILYQFRFQPDTNLGMGQYTVPDFRCLKTSINFSDFWGSQDITFAASPLRWLCLWSVSGGEVTTCRCVG